MVIIGISNIPPRMNLKQLVVCLAPTIGGQFEALNFKVVQRCRTAYVRLADTIAVKEVIQRINSKKIGPNQVKAFIPDVVPDLPIAYSPKSIPAKLRRKLKIPLNCTPKEIVRNAVLGIMREMQTKFTGLCKLSQDTNHQLLGDIAVMVYRRVKAIVDDPRPYDVNSFKVSKTYRRKYPHGGDFALIVSTLHDIEDAQGRPRSTVKENKLTAVPQKTLFNVPYDEMRKLSNSHITRISQKLVEHVNNLEVTEQTSSPEQAARMKVRRQLKTLVPHLESMVKSVIEKHLLPETDKFCPVKIYGEPMLPFKELMQPFLAQFHPVSTTRAEQVHNLIMLKVPRATYLKLLQANGVTINGVKLIIRPGKVNYYDVTRYLSANTDWASEMPGPAEPEAHAGASGDMDWSDSW